MPSANTRAVSRGMATAEAAPVLLTRVCLVALSLGGCSADRAATPRAAPAAATHTTTIHVPARLSGVPSSAPDARGRPGNVACVTCHSLRKPAGLPTTMAALREFHQGLAFDHGKLSCGTCHEVGDQRTVHLADGTRVAMIDAIQLCRQCHGPQARDYDHGAHGGMTGYWDLSVGDRTRNHCIDCHDVHAPRFAPSVPVLPPLDRGLARSAVRPHAADRSAP